MDRAHDAHNGSAAPATSSIRVVTQMVPLTCSVYAADGTAVPGLERANFRIFDNGVEQKISYFDASSSPASIALVIDASPSVLRDSDEMKKAADALVDALAPLDQAAVVDFSAHTYVQLPFSDVRELVRRAVARIDVRRLLSDTGGSNIYEAVYLTARELFAGRNGRKAIVLLTDGQDSGLGLTLDPASASPQPGGAEHRLTFDDVARMLTAQDIQLFALSTENRPKVDDAGMGGKAIAARLCSPRTRGGWGFPRTRFTSRRWFDAPAASLITCGSRHHGGRFSTHRPENPGGIYARILSDGGFSGRRRGLAPIKGGGFRTCECFGDSSGIVLRCGTISGRSAPKLMS